MSEAIGGCLVQNKYRIGAVTSSSTTCYTNNELDLLINIYRFTSKQTPFS